VPSLTESLSALGLSKNIVGVSRYCSFSTEVCNKTKVGTSINLNYEKILELKPDIVVLSSSTKSESIRNLKKLDIKTITFKHDRVSDVVSTFKTMGEVFNKEKQSKKIVNEIHNDFKKSSGKFKGVKVFLVIGASIKNREVLSAHVAGSKNFYNDIFKEIGIENIYSSSIIAFPHLDRERLLMNNADYIIQIFEKNNVKKINTSKEAWEKLFSSMKVKTKYISLVGNYLYIPGPRIGDIAIQLSEKMKELNVRSK
jgi:iron complex transport system substrate-binding protein